MQILAIKDEEFYEGMGAFFVPLTAQLGFDTILRGLGRNLRDMLLNLDNLHDYLRATFPRIKPPSFFIEEESESRKNAMRWIGSSFIQKRWLISVHINCVMKLHI